MSLFKKPLNKQPDDADDDSDEPQVLPDGVCFRWYFMTVGYAMGNQVYTSICKYDEFQIVGGGRDLSPGKLGVRYYLGTEHSASDGQFSGFEFKSGNAKTPVGSLSQARSALGGGGEQQAIIVILEDSRFDSMNVGFQDYLNRKYIEMGALPVARLLYTDNGEDAKRLLDLFAFKEENTPVLAWKKRVDFFTPDPQPQLPEDSEVTFSCPNCTQHLAVHESYRGEQVPCPTCEELVTVPPRTALSSTVPPPLPPAPPSRRTSPPSASFNGPDDSGIRAQARGKNVSRVSEEITGATVSKGKPIPLWRKLFRKSNFAEDMQVYDAAGAVAALFKNGAIAFVAPASHDDIRASYVDIAESWGDNGLYCGTESEIEGIVLANLTELVREPDFYTFKLHTIKRGATHAAQVSAILRERGMVGVRIWKSQQGVLYVCGSRSFKGRKDLLATTSAEGQKEAIAKCPRCAKPTVSERASPLLEGHTCSSCGWAAVWCYACRKSPMKAIRQEMIELGTHQRSFRIFLKCGACGKDKNADDVVTRWLQTHRADIQNI